MKPLEARTERRKRLARGLAAVGWWFLVFWFARETIRTRDSNPDHLIATIVLAYLAGWCPILALSRWSPAGKFARFAACTISIGAAFLVVETPALLSLVDYRDVFHTPTPPWRRSGNMPDPDLLYTRKPRQRLSLRFQGSDLHGLRNVPDMPAYNCDVLLDEQGFRNPLGLDSAEVVLIGDSFVEGLQVADDELISTRLEAELGLSVANLGRTGYGPQQELAVLDRYTSRYSPQTCVWFFYEGNDLQDLASYEAERERVGKLRPESARRAWYGRSFVRNAGSWLIRPGVDAGAPDAQTRAGVFPQADGADAKLYFSCGVHEGNPDAVENRADAKTIDRLTQVLAEAGSICQTRGMTLIVAFVPAKFRVYHDLCQFDVDSPCRDWPVDDLPGVMARALAEAGSNLEFLDLTPHLRARAKAGSLVYLPDDTHWSAQGHQEAAEAVADVLRRREPPRNLNRTVDAYFGAVSP